MPLPPLLPSRSLPLALAGALCVLLGLGMAQGSADRWLLLQLNALGPGLAHTASALSVLGLGAAMFIVSAALGTRRPLLPAAVLCVVLGGGLLVQLLKSGMAQPRPFAVLGPQLHVIGTAFTSRAMPSGHAALFVAMAALVCLLPRRRPSVVERWGMAAVAVPLALAGALARSVVGVHWPSDLLVGGGLGLLCVVLLCGTAAGCALLQGLARALAGRAGSRAMVALVVATSASLWVSVRDYPLAEPWYGALSLLGLWAAWQWWQLHPVALPWPLRGRRVGAGS